MGTDSVTIEIARKSGGNAACQAVSPSQHSAWYASSDMMNECAQTCQTHIQVATRRRKVRHLDAGQGKSLSPQIDVGRRTRMRTGEVLTGCRPVRRLRSSLRPCFGRLSAGPIFRADWSDSDTDCASRSGKRKSSHPSVQPTATSASENWTPVQ